RVTLAVALEDLDGRGLACPVGAEHGEDLAVLDLEVQACDGALGAITFVQVGDLDRRGRCHVSSVPPSGTAPPPPQRSTSRPPTGGRKVTTIGQRASPSRSAM